MRFLAHSNASCLYREVSPKWCIESNAFEKVEISTDSAPIHGTKWKKSVNERYIFWKFFFLVRRKFILSQLLSQANVNLFRSSADCKYDTFCAEVINTSIFGCNFYKKKLGECFNSNANLINSTEKVMHSRRSKVPVLRYLELLSQESVGGSLRRISRKKN